MWKTTYILQNTLRALQEELDKSTKKLVKVSKENEQIANQNQRGRTIIRRENIEVVTLFS